METNMNKYAMFTLKFHKDNAILQAIAEITLIINFETGLSKHQSVHKNKLSTS